MRIYQYEKFKGIESLTPAWRPTPKPGPGQVLVRIHAVSLNYKDLLWLWAFLRPRNQGR